jgi:TRAP-type C4-dicarboxylate transport system substrate-binding protein
LPNIAPANPYLNARIINELMATKLKDEFNKRGVYPAHVMPLRPLNLMSKEAIRTPEDLRGKKIVSYMNAPGAAETLGFSEVHLPFPEIYTALQQGLIDAVIWVDMGFIPFKIYEQAKFYTAINLSPVTIETCLNRQSFDKLSKPLKQFVYDFQQKVGIAVVEETEKFAKNAHSTLLENKVDMIELSDAEKLQWKAAFAPSVEEWMKRCEEAGKDCRSLVSDIQRLEQKYRGLSDEELMRLAIEEPIQGIIEF